MTYETFEKIITTLEQLSVQSSAAYKLGVDLSEYTDKHFEVINLLLKEAFGEDGSHWVSWFLYERDGRKDMKAWDKDGNEICFDIPSLWKEVSER